MLDLSKIAFERKGTEKNTLKDETIVINITYIQ